MREPQIPNKQTTRLAPSPTGTLHLGNAFSFVLNWAIARKLSWEIALRIEDLDSSRVRSGMNQQAIDTLTWLGLDWDRGPIIQSDRIEHYQNAMETLASRQLIYPCDLSRAQIKHALSAPHLGDPGEPLSQLSKPTQMPTRFSDAGRNWRLVRPKGHTRFHDACQGDQVFDHDALGADFIVWTKRHAPSYQLAVVVDDHASGVTQIVRGRDLIDSAARQLILYRALELTPEPTYTHLPLVLDADGRRLAKRDQDIHIERYSRSGGPERIIGLIAFWCGLTPDRQAMSLCEFQSALDPHTLVIEDIRFTQEDARWLDS